MAAILPRVYPQMLDEVHAHQDAGRPTFIVSAAGNDVVESLAAVLGMEGGIGTRYEVDADGQLHRPPRRPLRLRPRQGRGDGGLRRRATRSTSPPPTPTRTRSRTCRCCARSATRSPSTRTRRWPRSPSARAGRRCASSASAAASSPLAVTCWRRVAGFGASRVAARRRPPPPPLRPPALDWLPMAAEPRFEARVQAARGRVHDHLRAADRAALRPERTLDRRPRGAGRPARRVPVHPRPLPVDVPGPALDDAPVRRLRHGRGDQRALPLPARPRPDRALDRLRHADPDGLRLRPRPQPRRGRPRGRRRRHASTTWSSSSRGSRSAASPPR